MINGDTVCHYHVFRRVSQGFVITTEFRYSVSKYCAWLNDECVSYLRMTQHADLIFTTIDTQFCVSGNLSREL